ncbi:TonB-dependent receptor [Flagellimonas meridianipacifica]|uniref:Outer membrane receptor protein involved in Fe transport n=1 Tax=Flagellimonas meridianipacifica TaxID=1080225 RepID=A0A2T0MB03_9FLAO|nr:TonB-dependent receptor [Allomuricauda pacifica]PRX54698.1 outer membrane receptor protein involved in Fe transport [Allomuricauda pacifica]
MNYKLHRTSNYVRVLLFTIFTLCIFKTHAQERLPSVSLNTENQSIVTVFEILQEQTGFKFYYDTNWFGAEGITKSYTNVAVDVVLKDILRDTDINFYIDDDNNVFLTRNSFVYDTLPENFFGEQEESAVIETEEIETDTGPVFEDKTRRVSERVETVRIGKATSNRNQSEVRLTGRVTDFITGKPVPDLSILVDDGQQGTSTNSNGEYSINIKRGTHVIKVSGLGYKDRVKNAIVYNSGVLDFSVEESIEALDEVVVSENARRNVEIPVTGLVSLEIEQIKTIPLVLGERDILKAALTLPGISNAGEGASGFNVRGGKTDQNLVLLDDGVIYNPSHFFGIFSALNPFSTGSADIYKGSIPVQFGGRLSSVFDLKTKTPNTEKFSGEAAIGPVTSNLVLEVPIKKEKAGLLVGGRGTYSGWILRSLDDEQLSESEASFFDVVAKYNHTLDENNEIRATGYFSRDAFSITSDSIFNYSNRLASLRWNHKFNEKNTGSLILTNSQYRFNIEFDGDSNTDFDLGYINNESELRLEFNYLHSKAHKFKYGISGKLYQIDPGNVDPLNADSEVTPLSIPRERAVESALFFSDTYTVNEKLLIDAGVRLSLYAALGEGIQRIYEENAPRNSSTLVETREFDQNEVIETYGGPEFRISGRYFLNPDLSLKASFNNTFQYIHTLNSNTTVSQTDTYKLSDLNIRPQQANQFSLGLFKNFKDNEYELSIEGFYKRQRNLLDFEVGAQLLLNETVEAEVLQGDGRAYGVEFLLRKNEGRLNGWLGYSYSRSFIRLDSPFREERVNNGEFFPTNFDRPHDVSLVTNYKITNRLSASANFVYQTGRPVTFPLGQFEFDNADFVFFSDRNEFRIPDFYRLDLSINLEGNHKIKKFAHSFWSLSIYNVLGRNNPFSVFFVTENGEVRALQSSIFAIPIPTITYNFKF